MKPKDALIAYGEALPSTFEYTYSGFIGSDDFKAASAPSVKVSGDITGAGSYTLYVEGGDPGANYTIVGRYGNTFCIEGFIEDQCRNRQHRLR